MIPLSRYEAGEVIIQENDVGETAYVINQGQVEVSKELQGQKVHLASLGAAQLAHEETALRVTGPSVRHLRPRPAGSAAAASDAVPSAASANGASRKREPRPQSLMEFPFRRWSFAHSRSGP